MGTGYRGARARRTVLHQPGLILCMEHALTAAALLNAWERGRFQAPVDRALTLLSLSGQAEPSRFSQCSIGRRDAELLRLREAIFGATITGRTDCPACQQPVELNFEIADLRAEPAADLPQAIQGRFGQYELEFKLPTSADLAGLPQAGDLESKKRALLLRCVTRASCNGDAFPADQLPGDIINALSARMAELDPQGDVELALTCPHCRRVWNSPLDVVSFLWSEIEAWAGRLLHEVHTLASAYGWREGDILAMSAWRRQAYLERIAP